MVELSFSQLVKEPCVYTKKGGDSRLAMVALYVDDFFVFCDDDSIKNDLYNELNRNFRVKLLGPVENCLGIKVVRDREAGTLTLSQAQYIRQLITRFGLKNARPAKTPMEVCLKLQKEKTCQSSLPYRQLIGGLMYAAVYSSRYCIFME